jgi:hypothetical protein
MISVTDLHRHWTRPCSALLSTRTYSPIYCPIYIPYWPPQCPDVTNSEQIIYNEIRREYLTPSDADGTIVKKSAGSIEYSSHWSYGL